MLINKLKLKNFKQYKDEIINFPTGLTGLVGRNGAGKSTVFDAISFALFGPLKGVNLSQLKNDNAPASEPVEVELEFIERNKEYVVKRALRGVAQTTKVGLYRVDQQNIVALAENATEVAKELYKIIKLDKDSFVNSFFAKQKETAGLLASTPAERVIEIRKMLGFDRLDAISKTAGNKLKTLKYEMEAAASLLLDDQRIADLNELIQEKKNELAALTQEHDQLKQSVDAKLTEKGLQQRKVDGLRILQEKHNELEKEIATIKTAISKTEESISSTETEISRLITLELEAERLSPIVELLQKLRTQQAEMQTKKENAALYESIFSNKTKAETELASIEEQIARLSATIATMENAPNDLQLKTVIKEGFEREESLLNANALDLGKEIAGYDARLKQTIKRLKHVEGLDAAGTCPECERELGTQKPVLIKKYKAEIAELNALIAEIGERESQVKKNLSEKRAEVKKLQDEIADLGKTIVKLENDRAQLTTLSGNREKTIAKISSAERDLSAVGPRDFDKEAFTRLGEEVKSAEIKNDEYQKMLGEIGTLPAQEKHLSDYTATLNESKEKLSTKQNNLVELNFNVDELTTADSLLKQKQQEHLDLVGAAHKAELELNTIKSEVSSAEAALHENDERKGSFEQLRTGVEKYKIFKEIIDNFKARITSEAIPKISQEANRLFVEITKERYNGLHIDTENYDIKVMRDDKEALIETLSGGEKDLAAVCLRIAVSRHIINMSGAGNMGFLALDEVFGSQDEGRRADLMFALSKISDWFKQVFIVAHNQDVEEAFPNKMIISKKGLYSAIDCRFASSTQ